VRGIAFRNPDIGGVEPNVIFVIERLMAGYPVYEDPEQSPYSVAQYSPLYYFLTAGIARRLHIDPGPDVWAVYATARSISFIAWLLTAVVLYVFSMRVLKLGAFAAFVLAALSLIVPAINGIAARPDSLARLLMLTGFFCYLIADRAERRAPGRAWLALSLSLVTVAVWTKQTAAPMLLIFAILSVLRKRWSDLAWIGGLPAVGSVLIYMVLSGPMGGFWPFYRNIVTGASACGVHLEWASNVLAHFPFAYGALIAVFLATIYIYLGQRRKWSRDVTALLLAGAVLLALFAVVATRYGIWINHAYEAIIFMTLGVATFWRRQTEESGPSLIGHGAAMTAAAYVVVFSLAQTALTLYQNHSVVWHPERDWLQVGTQEKVVQAVQRELDRYPGRQVFAYWVPYVNVRLFERAVVPQVEIVGTCTYRRNVFRYDRFVADVKNGRVKFVVTKYGQILPAFAGADLSRFEPLRRIGDFMILAQPD